MNVTLIKASVPGWEKKFDNADSACAELLKHICGACLTGSVFGAGDEPELIQVRTPPDKADIHALLGTACGLEFWLEEANPVSVEGA